MDEVKLTIEIENPDMLAELFGQRDENVRVIEDERECAYPCRRAAYVYPVSRSRQRWRKP